MDFQLDPTSLSMSMSGVGRSSTCASRKSPFAESCVSPEVLASAAASRFFADKVEELQRKHAKFGAPGRQQTASLLRSLPPLITRVLKWKDGCRVNLRHPDIAVRKVDRAFTSLCWSYQDNAPLIAKKGKGVVSRAPTIAKVIDAMHLLSRFFSEEYPKWLMESKEGMALIAERRAERDAVAAISLMDNTANSASQSCSGGAWTGDGDRAGGAMMPPVPPAPAAGKYYPPANAVGVELGSTSSRPPFLVHGSKKGGFPVMKEKRNRGKVVTIIRRVTGKQQLLLKDLKSKFGCGGKLIPSAGGADDQAFDIEIQGDLQERVKSYLAKRGCIKGVSGAQRAKAEGLTGKSKGKTRKKNVGVGGGVCSGGGGSSGGVKSCTSSKAVTVLTMDIKKMKAMKPAQLKAQLKARGLTTQGNKKELLKRLLELSIA